MGWRKITSFIAILEMLLSGVGIWSGLLAALVIVIEATYDNKISNDERSKYFRMIMLMLLGYFAIHFWTAFRLMRATEINDADKALKMSKHWQRLNWILLIIGFLFVTSHILVRVGFLVRALLAYVVWRFDCDLENGL